MVSARLMTGAAIGSEPTPPSAMPQVGLNCPEFSPRSRRPGAYRGNSMSSHKRRSLALSFVDRHRLWSGAQVRAAMAVEKAITQKKLELVRFSFPDQHGVLRSKTLVATEASHALRSGVTMTGTLFAKDTAHRTVFPVFEPDAGMGISEMGGAGNFIMVADPQTF